MRRWLDIGVDGFRLDAIPYLCERDGTNNENLPETHAIIKQIRAELDAYAPGKVLLAEANQWPEDVSAYFGDGDECHMAYHFPLMPRIYMAIAQEDRFPIADILRQTPDIPANCQWALFLRNHDELTLEMVTDVERDYLWSTYATDPRARINLGIRRRLAPLMDNDRRKIELMNSLLMSLPGTPIIYYGDEIGMGDNIYLGDRNGVRTPMQWTPDRNGGFSRCDPGAALPADDHGPGLRLRGGQRRGAVAQPGLAAELDQAADLRAQVEQACSAAARSPSSGRPTARCWSMCGSTRTKSLLCVANLSRSAQAAEIDLSPWRGRVPLRNARAHGFPADRRPALCRHARALRLLLVPARVKRDEADGYARATAPEFETLVVTDGWDFAVAGPRQADPRTRRAAGLPGGARWFAERGSRSITDTDCGVPFRSKPGDPGIALALVEATGARETAHYLLPLTIKWTAPRPRADETRTRSPPCAAGRARARCSMSPPTRIHLASCWTRCGLPKRSKPAMLPARIPADRRISRAWTGDAGERSRRRYRAVEHHGAGRQRLRRQALPPPRAGINPGDRDRALPDRNRPRSPIRRRCSAPSNWSRTASAARSPWFIASSKTRAMPGRSTNAYLDRFVEEQRLLTAEPSGESEEQARLSAADAGRSAGASPNCSSRSPAATTLPISRRSRSPRRRSADVDRSSCWSAPTACSTNLPRRTPRFLGGRPRADRHACWLTADRLPARLNATAAGQHRGGEDPPSRRLPSRPDADRQGRRLHHRLRGRAAPQPGGAAAQGAGGARRRRPDPLDRLFGHRGAGPRAAKRRRTSTASSPARSTTGASVRRKPCSRLIATA